MSDQTNEPFALHIGMTYIRSAYEYVNAEKEGDTNKAALFAHLTVLLKEAFPSIIEPIEAKSKAMSLGKADSSVWQDDPKQRFFEPK